MLQVGCVALTVCQKFSCLVWSADVGSLAAAVAAVAEGWPWEADRVFCCPPVEAAPADARDDGMFGGGKLNGFCWSCKCCW